MFLNLTRRSPISKTAYARKHTHTGAVKAATIAAFNREDMNMAMRAVRRNVDSSSGRSSDSAEVAQLRQQVRPALVKRLVVVDCWLWALMHARAPPQVTQLQAELVHEANAKGERVKALRKELAQSEHDKDIRQRKFDDAIRTSLRESFRLKNDLRCVGSVCKHQKITHC